MKKIITSLGLGLLLSLTASAQINFSQASFANTNVAQAYTNLMFVGACKVAQVQILAGSTAVTIGVMDANYAGVVWTNSAYTTLTNYSTNLPYSYVSPLTGTTNLQTNTVIVTTSLSVAAGTNNLLPAYTFFAQPNTLATYPVNLLMSKGIVVTNSTNCSFNLVYRIND